MRPLNLGMNDTLHRACNYLSIQGLKLYHDSKRDPRHFDRIWTNKIYSIYVAITGELWDFLCVLWGTNIEGALYRVQWWCPWKASRWGVCRWSVSPDSPEFLGWFFARKAECWGCFPPTPSQCHHSVHVKSSNGQCGQSQNLGTRKRHSETEQVSLSTTSAERPGYPRISPIFRLVKQGIISE